MNLELLKADTMQISKYMWPSKEITQKHAYFIEHQLYIYVYIYIQILPTSNPHKYQRIPL